MSQLSNPHGSDVTNKMLEFFVVFCQLSNPHGSDVTFYSDRLSVNVKRLSNPHGSDVTGKRYIKEKLQRLPF